MAKSLCDAVTEMTGSVEQAMGLILAGRVLVNDSVESRPGILVKEKDRIRIRENERGEYVSRAALKLGEALKVFEPPIAGKVCLDIGASTGGFTQVLLQQGASKVYAMDVGYGLLDYSLRRDERVVSLEKRNIRHIQPDWFDLPEIERLGLFITCDVSFISLRTVLLALSGFLRETSLRASGLFLLKPQFEASAETDKGILRDEGLRKSIVTDLLLFAQEIGFQKNGVVEASLSGARGNQETVIYLSWPGE